MNECNVKECLRNNTFCDLINPNRYSDKLEILPQVNSEDGKEE